jgi:hypothetical protein
MEMNVEVYQAPPVRGNGLIMEVVTRRTLMDMEAALEKSVRWLPPELNVHEVRSYVGQCILQRVHDGAGTQDAMVRAGIAAVNRVVQGKENRTLAAAE